MVARIRSQQHGKVTSRASANIKHSRAGDESRREVASDRTVDRLLALGKLGKLGGVCRVVVEGSGVHTPLCVGP